jgi:hypothetical protein
MLEAYTMIVGGLKMAFIFLPEAKGNHRSTVAFELWDETIGQSEEIPIFDEDADE